MSLNTSDKYEDIVIPRNGLYFKEREPETPETLIFKVEEVKPLTFLEKEKRRLFRRKKASYK